MTLLFGIILMSTGIGGLGTGAVLYFAQICLEDLEGSLAEKISFVSALILAAGLVTTLTGLASLTWV
jgi:hypothetical protein